MYRRYSMAIKLPVAVFFACLILGFLSTILLSSYTSKLSNDVVMEKSELSVNQLVELIRSSLFNEDTISVQVALRRATADQAIFSASVYDNDNQLIAQSTTAGDKP
ncbi:MAG: putative membrane protein affecting hemolysin expression, partial [Porticoccaceae bacterium]